MWIAELLSAIQIIIASFQLKLDHFSKSNINSNFDIENFYKLWNWIRSLEFAISETMAYIGLNPRNRDWNGRLSSLWQSVSQDLREIQWLSDLSQISYEKSLYWRNPRFYEENKRTDYIALNNILDSLKKTRKKYDLMLSKKSK